MRERLEKYCYTKKDFILDWYSGQGAGGQHRNRHKNCLRLTHIPSGLTVSATEHRERSANQKLAFQRLKPLLANWIEEQIRKESSHTPQDTNEVVRTYNVVDNRVTDHSSGLKTDWKGIDKSLADHIEARLQSGSSDKESGRT